MNTLDQIYYVWLLSYSILIIFPVLRICEYNRSIESRIVVDTYDAHYYDNGSCSCSIGVVTENVTDISKIFYDKINNLHPSQNNCGSKLTLKIPSMKNELNYNCGLFSNEIEIRGDEFLELIWTSTSEESIPGYCILMEFKGKLKNGE